LIEQAAVDLAAIAHHELDVTVARTDRGIRIEQLLVQLGRGADGADLAEIGRVSIGVNEFGLTAEQSRRLRGESADEVRGDARAMRAGARGRPRRQGDRRGARRGSRLRSARGGDQKFRVRNIFVHVTMSDDTTVEKQPTEMSSIDVMLDTNV